MGVDFGPFPTHFATMADEIEDVWVKRLVVHPDERGRLMEILRSDDDGFRKFGQVYMTTTYPGVVKAWHLHKIQDDNFCCVSGMVKLVLFDDRADSPTRGSVKEYFIGDHNPLLVRVPPGVLHGWKCISESEAIVINASTEPYDPEAPDEYREPFDSPKVLYDWDIVFR